MNVILREIRESDLSQLERWWQPDQDWHRWDAPYFPKSDSAGVRNSIEHLAAELDHQPEPLRRMIIADRDQQLLGMASWHWEHEPSRWARCGLSVYDPDIRGCGVGTDALRLLAGQVFTRTPAFRLDFATWSGNVGMCRVGEKLGWQREATFRLAREVRGQRYDSVVYGLLRTEWETIPADQEAQ